ncbi:quattro isoform 2-T2 [Spinachia spinachia]
MLDFLIPSKHLLESIQQAACAGYSDVVFRCEGWPLCLHDKTIIQLAPVNPLLLRPGDFYLQVEPFGDQAARVVLKSLLEEGCREVEETPIPETSYPCIFTEEWLQDINEGRQETPLSRCLLCTDQGVIKVPWAKIAIPEFLDKPKVMPSFREPPPEPKQISVLSRFTSSTLPMAAIVVPAKDRIPGSLRPVDCSSKLIKMNHKRQTSKSCSRPLIKPVGWVSPNTWDSRTYQGIEGDYVDLVDIATGTEFVDKHSSSNSHPQNSGLFKPVRPPPPVPLNVTNNVPYGCNLQYTEDPRTPCSQRRLEHEPTDQELKCRYRDSYVAALRNPVAFERGSVDFLAALEEVVLCEDPELKAKGAFEAQRDKRAGCCNNCNKPVIRNDLSQYKHCCEATPESFASHLKDLPTSSHSGNPMRESPKILKSTPGLSQSHKVQMKLISHQSGQNTGIHPGSDGDVKAPQKVEVVKPSGKHKTKGRSLSTVSETSKGSPLLYKVNNRSHSDICPETITSIMKCKKADLLDQVTLKLERLNSPKQDSHLSRREIPSTADGPDFKVHNSKIEKLSPAELLSTSSDSNQPPQTKESGFRGIVGMLELGIICLPGSRDRTGRAVIEVNGDRKEWTSSLVSVRSVCELLLYLHSIPRKEVQELGMTLVINSRKKPPSLHLYKALLMAQEQALHAVHSIVMVVDKDTCPRPEKQPGLQMDMVTSMKALNKTVEASQLTSDLGGTFTYSHTDWLQFHQRLVAFMAELRGADSLLQKAINKVDCSKTMDTAQEVQQCIQEQKASMREVLEDTRLVTLQREGGAALARMRREEFRFPQSEDYRDALESVTSLYNEVEEKLHTLVMRSNESLLHLEFLFKLREMEAKICTAGLWFNAEGEQTLKDSYTTEDTLVCTEKALLHFEVFLTKSKEKQQHALSLVRDAKAAISTSNTSPATEVFRTLVSTFKSNVDDFMLRAEQRHKELDTLVRVHRFCEEAAALAKECFRFLEQVEQGCYSAQTLRTLQMYEERLGGKFSTPHFQALKAETCAMGSGASGMMRVWNAALVQCQQVGQRLKEMQKKEKGVDKIQIQRLTAANPQAEGREKEKEKKTQQRNSQKEVINIAECEEKRTRAACFDHHLKPDSKGESQEQKLPEAAVKTEKIANFFPQYIDRYPETRQSPRDHHSEADLRSTHSVEGDGDFPLRHPLGRSLSEGSCVCSRLMCTSGFSPLNVRHKHCQSETQPLEQNLQPATNLPVSHSEAVRSGNLSCESKRESNEEEGGGSTVSTQSPKDLRASETLLTQTENDGINVLKLQMIMEELLSTERQYVKALGYVREHYFSELERPDVPQDLRGRRGSVFGNLEKLHDFHHHHFLNELESCVDEPLRVGRCFLRHSESFALYALYSKNKPQSDSLLINHGQAFFKQKQLKLRDKMDLCSYLLKPVQRISKYSLLLQDMMRECGPGQTREVAEVKAALEVIHFQLHHGNNLLAMDAIHHCDVNLKEQGQLIRQDEFLVTFRKKKCSRHIFLFQELILFSKTRKTDIGNETYIYKQSFKTSDVGMTQNSGDSGLCFEIWFRKRKTQDTYTLQAASQEVKDAWTKDLERILWEQAVHNREVRMQERVFMGIGNKPFKDIQPSDAAINDRAVNYVPMARENRAASCMGSRDSRERLPEGRPKSGCSSSSSSSSSGRSSLSPVGYMYVPKRRGVGGGLGGYVSPAGALEEDDLDHENRSHNLLLDSSESSGESVSGFSSSSHSYHSTIGGEVEDTSLVSASMITVKLTAVRTEASAVFQEANPLPGSPGKTKPPVAPKPKTKPQPQGKDLLCAKVQNISVEKSTEV